MSTGYYLADPESKRCALVFTRYAGGLSHPGGANARVLMQWLFDTANFKGGPVPLLLVSEHVAFDGYEIVDAENLVTFLREEADELGPSTTAGLAAFDEAFRHA